MGDVSAESSFDELVGGENGPEPDGNALVVGSGLGDDAAWLRSLGLRVVGSMCPLYATAISRRRFLDDGLSSFVTANGSQLPFARDTFSFVLESYTLQCLHHDLRREHYPETSSILKPGGLKCF